MLAKSHFSSIETLISQALFDMDISHKEFVIILMEKHKYEKMKENLRSENEDLYEIMRERESSVKSKTKKINLKKLITFWYNIKVKNY